VSVLFRSQRSEAGCQQDDFPVHKADDGLLPEGWQCVLSECLCVLRPGHTSSQVKEPDVSIPKPAKWEKAGEILGESFSLAYRTFDAQYWGVPQRRMRIYFAIACTPHFSDDTDCFMKQRRTAAVQTGSFSGDAHILAIVQESKSVSWIFILDTTIHFKRQFRQEMLVWSVCLANMEDITTFLPHQYGYEVKL